MSAGIEKTLRLLAESKNKTAAQLLEAALESSDETVRQHAKRELASLRGGKSLAGLIRRFDPENKELVGVLEESRDKTVQTLRSSLLGSDAELARKALKVVLTQRYFELIPVLLTIFMDQSDRLGDDGALAETIATFVEEFAAALDSRKHRRFLYGKVLPEILKTVSKGLAEFHRNDPTLILRIFLTLYAYTSDEQRNPGALLQNPSSPAYLAMYHLLLKAEEQYVCRFVFYCLDNELPPPLAVTVFSKRQDVDFLGYFFERFDKPASKEFRDNLERIRHVDWLDDRLPSLLADLDDERQPGLVKLVPCLGLSSEQKRAVLETILRDGKPTGRREALGALARYHDERMERTIWNAAEDPDPGVQIAALTLLRDRNSPAATTRIIQFADSPHEAVREAVHELLPQFRLTRYLETFDQMNEEQRRRTFNLIKTIDTNIVDELANMLMLGEPLMKAKALLCVEYGDLVGPLEDSLCGVLAKGEMPSLRGKAAELLAGGRRELSRSALVQALHRDTSPEVCEAAKSSLEKRPPPWKSR